MDGRGVKGRELRYNYESDGEEKDSEGEVEGSLLASSAGRRGRRKSKRSGCPCRYRWVNNRGALMVLAWNLLVFSYQYQALDSILQLLPSYAKWTPWRKMSANIAMELCLPLLLYPLAGWLADTKLGRYRVMKGSMWIMWIGSVILLCDLTLHYFFTYRHPQKAAIAVLNLPVAIAVYVLNAIGLAGFQANIIPFGVDQMEDGSAEQYSSFVHWYYWTRNFSLGLMITIALQSSAACHPSTEHTDRIGLIILVSEVGFLSLALLLDFFFSHILIKEPKAQNPLQTVFKVSLFIARHNQPVGQRSAMTYDRGYYSRSDLATVPFGGPFEVESVEAVKTFWRMIVFLATASLAIIPIYTVNNEMSYLIGPQVQSQNCYLKYLVVNATNPLVFIIALPVYELVVYPLIHKYILSMSNRIGIGYLLGLVTVVGSLVVSLLAHKKGSERQCTFYTSEEQLDVSEWSLLVPLLVSSFGEMLVFIPAYEFICAQSPYNMRGLLIGLFYALQGLADGIAALILVIFASGYSGQRLQKTLFGCEFWFNFTILLFTIATLVLYFVVVRWYRNRERGYWGQEYVNQRAILEAYYDSTSAAAPTETQ